MCLINENLPLEAWGLQWKSRILRWKKVSDSAQIMMISSITRNYVVVLSLRIYILLSWKSWYLYLTKEDNLITYTLLVCSFAYKKRQNDWTGPKCFVAVGLHTSPEKASWWLNFQKFASHKNRFLNDFFYKILKLILFCFRPGFVKTVLIF